MSKTKEVRYEWNDSKTWWNGLDSLSQDNLDKKYFPFFNYSELSDFNIEEICIQELQEENTRLWEEMDRYIGATKIALELTAENERLKGLCKIEMDANEKVREANSTCHKELQRIATTLSLIRPLAFADHSSVEYNMEEIRKILNNVK